MQEMIACEVFEDLPHWDDDAAQDEQGLFNAVMAPTSAIHEFLDDKSLGEVIWDVEFAQQELNTFDEVVLPIRHPEMASMTSLLSVDAVCSVFDERPQVVVLWDEEVLDRLSSHEGLLQQLAGDGEFLHDAEQKIDSNAVFLSDGGFSHISSTSTGKSCMVASYGFVDFSPTKRSAFEKKLKLSEEITDQGENEGSSKLSAGILTDQFHTPLCQPASGFRPLSKVSKPVFKTKGSGVTNMQLNGRERWLQVHDCLDQLHIRLASIDATHQQQATHLVRTSMLNQITSGHHVMVKQLEDIIQAAVRFDSSQRPRLPDGLEVGNLKLGTLLCPAAAGQTPTIFSTNGFNRSHEEITGPCSGSSLLQQEPAKYAAHQVFDGMPYQLIGKLDDTENKQVEPVMCAAKHGPEEMPVLDVMKVFDALLNKASDNLQLEGNYRDYLERLSYRGGHDLWYSQWLNHQLELYMVAVRQWDPGIIILSNADVVILINSLDCHSASRLLRSRIDDSLSWQAVLLNMPHSAVNLRTGKRADKELLCVLCAIWMRIHGIQTFALLHEKEFSNFVCYWTLCYELKSIISITFMLLVWSSNDEILWDVFKNASSVWKHFTVKLVCRLHHTHGQGTNQVLMMFWLTESSSKSEMCFLCFEDKALENVNATTLIMGILLIKWPWDPGIMKPAKLIIDMRTMKEELLRRGHAFAWGQAKFPGDGNVMTRMWPSRSPMLSSPFAKSKPKGRPTSRDYVTGRGHRDEGIEVIQNKHQRGTGKSFFLLRLSRSLSSDFLCAISSAIAHAPGLISPV